MMIAFVLFWASPHFHSMYFWILRVQNRRIPWKCRWKLRSKLNTGKPPLIRIPWSLTVSLWGEGNDEPLFLVTNFISASKACEYYAVRFTIETFFSDQKSRGFNIDRSHLFSPQRLTRLMYASCLAYLWIIFFGILALETGLYKRIHRTDRCYLSLFQLGLRLLNYLAVRGLPIPYPRI